MTMHQNGHMFNGIGRHHHRAAHVACCSERLHAYKQQQERRQCSFPNHLLLGYALTAETSNNEMQFTSILRAASRYPEKPSRSL